jgi:ThiF family
MSDPFDRTRRLITSLGGGDEAIAAMASVKVELVMPHPTPGDEIALALAATLLLRLDKAAPVLSIQAPQMRQAWLPLLGDGPLGDEIALAHEGFSSVERLSQKTLSDPDLRLVFGASDMDGLPVASTGWTSMLGTRLDGAGPGNPLAASFAGVLASIEALKRAFLDAGLAADRIRPWLGSVSLWDYGIGGQSGPALDVSLPLDDTAIVGAGGIGSPFGWILSLLDRHGSPLIVDDDVVDGTSLNRHLTAGFAQIGRSKAELLADLLRSERCEPRVQRHRWQTLPSGERSPRIAIVTVDNDPTRRDVQMDMPRWLLNAGTSDDGLYRASRHDFVTGACAACLSHADERSSGPLESVALLLGIDLKTLEPLLARREPLPSEILHASTLTEEDRERLKDVPGTELVVAVCGTVRARPEDPAISAPMLSAAPAALLAADLVRLSLDPQRFSASDTSSSIFTGPHRVWTRTRSKRQDCQCADSAYAKFFRRKWGLGSTALA